LPPLSSIHDKSQQTLVSFADHAGRCWPSVRAFAVQAGISKSAAGRDLAELAEAGLVTRQRRPGGVYVYQIARRFLPKWAREQVSQHRDCKAERLRARRAERAATGVPEHGIEEKPLKKNQEEGARARDRFAKSGIVQGELSDPADQWKARLRSWTTSRFWLPAWGPRPNEPGCFAPIEVLRHG
jgi:DNA-binding transcriptional regulator YhcF (GntR family)